MANSSLSKPQRVIIMGAAGRDFHNFNVYFRNNQQYRVVAFTAAQIPDIEDKLYPASLAGEMYPQGIPIYAEEDLPQLITEQRINVVVFSYSDLPHEKVMNKASIVLAAGADFWLLGAQSTMVSSVKPVISVCAVRTGCGKSQTTRRVTRILQAMGKRVVAVRHPMPYGDLAQQKIQRFATVEDLKKHKCTIEEMEEYEPYITMGCTIFAGVDYEAILREAEKEADVIIWDGGNNDIPFYKSNLEIVVVDPHRPGHELSYHPGEVNFRRAQVIVINKVDTANYENVLTLRKNIHKSNPLAMVIEAASPIYIEKYEMIQGKKVLVIEDGPTLTHGEMKYGAGSVVALRYGAREIVDPRPYAVGRIKETFEIYPNIGKLLPAMGYGEEQMLDLEKTINATDCDLVVIGTPIDLNRIIKINKPSVRVNYELQEIGSPTLEDAIKRVL